MQLVFSDAQYWEDFLPLTFTRPVAEMRMGILTFAERWKKLLEIDEVFYITENYLQDKFRKPEPKQSLFIVPNFFPSDEVLKQIKELQPGEALVYENEVLVANINMDNFSLNQINKMTDIHEKLLFIEKPTDIFSNNYFAINFDFILITEGRTSQELF